MSKCTRWILLALILLALVAQGSTGFAQSDNPPINVELTVVRDPAYVHEDADWPIVRVERTERRDAETGDVYFTERVVRESPLGYPRRSVTGPKADACLVSAASASRSEVGVATYTCYYDGSIKSVTDADGHLGGITSWVKQYAEKWCRSDNGCVRLYKPYRVVMWWTRSNSSWWARDAWLEWFVNNSYDCQTNIWNGYYASSTYIPGWSSSTQSYYYNYYGNWPAIQLFDDFSFWMHAVARSKGMYGSSTFKGNMTANAALP